MAEKTDNNGILVNLVKQVSDNSPFINGEEGDTDELIVTYKGNYNVIKDYPATKFLPGTKLATAESTITLTEQFDTPAPRNGFEWIIASAKVEELESGQHGLLTVNCRSSHIETTTEDAWTDDPKQDLWTLTWQSYNVTPYAFCKNDPINDQKLKDYKPDVSETAYSRNIQQFLESRYGKATDFSYFVDPLTKELYRLNEAEALVSKKIDAGVNAIRHYPIVVHQTAKSKTFNDLSGYTPDKVKYPDDLGNEIDKLILTVQPTGQPTGCPFTLEGWSFIKVAEDINCVKENTKLTYYTKEVFWGAREWDENFYGRKDFNHNELETCRWELGKV
jgi:hypothetical protein